MYYVPYTKFLSRISSARKPSIIRELLKIMQTASKDMIPLSGKSMPLSPVLRLFSTWAIFEGGLPNPAMFPFENLSVQLKDGTTMPIK